jgi:hypothetical protein
MKPPRWRPGIDPVRNVNATGELNAYLVLADKLLRWTPAGYEPPTASLNHPARILTPPSVVRTLAAGYPAGIHASAFEALRAP